MFRSRKGLSYSYPQSSGQFNSNYADLPLKKCILNIPVTQTGSGTPSPDNIRDIIGVQGVNISRTGKNIFDYSKIRSQIIPSGLERSSFYIKGLSGYITVSRKTGADVYIGIYRPGSTMTEYRIIENSNRTVLLPDYNDVELWIWVGSGMNLATVGDIQIELGNTPTPYEPYTGNTYQITFGQTVYAGELDVLTGKLSITHELKTIDENSGTQIADNGIFFVNSFFEIGEDIDSIDCNLYQRANNQNSTTNVLSRNPDYSFCCKIGANATRIMIKHTTITTIETYNEWLSTNPVKIAVKLAEPIEIPVGGNDIKTLQGTNNIFADVGTLDIQHCNIS